MISSVRVRQALAPAVCCLLSLAGVDATPAAEPPYAGLAVVSRGSAQVVRRSESLRVDGSKSLQGGDRVRAGPHSIVAVVRPHVPPLMLRHGEELLVEVSASADTRLAPAPTGQRLLMEKIADLFLPKWVQTVSTADVLRSGENEPRRIATLYPANGPVLRVRPSFAWASAYREHRIRLYEAAKPDLWLYEQRVQAAGRMRYPAGWPDLKPGVRYFWEMVEMPGERALATASFEVVPAGPGRSVVDSTLRDVARECAAAMAAAQQCALFRAARLVEVGHRHEAIETLLEGADEGPSGQALTVILSNLTGEALKE